MRFPLPVIIVQLHLPCIETLSAMNADVAKKGIGNAWGDASGVGKKNPQGFRWEKNK
ncbi:MAG: hypothetical protein K8R90_05935 [Candidatus Cloacimonetes bacterium]|nr:hypothetical protein [Candidatus Cloacimonadota bacterium]